MKKIFLGLAFFSLFCVASVRATETESTSETSPETKKASSESETVKKNDDAKQVQEAPETKAASPENAAPAAVAPPTNDILRTGDYLEILEFGPIPPSVVQWDAISGRQLFLDAGHLPYLILTGVLSPGWHMQGQGLDLKIETGGHFTARLELPLQPKNFIFRVNGPGGENYTYLLATIWKKPPPSLSFKVKEEDQVYDYKSGVTGEFDPTIYSHLFLWGKATNAVSLSFGSESAITFRNYLPPDPRPKYEGWHFVIRNQKKEIVGEAQGKGDAPEVIAWSEVKPKVVVGQKYRYCLEFKLDGKDGNRDCGKSGNDFEVLPEEFNRFILTVSPKFSVFSMYAYDKTNNSSGTVNSNFNAGLDLGVARRLNRLLEPFLQFSLMRVDVAPFSSKSLTSNSEVLLSGRLGMSAHLSPRWLVSAGLAYAHQLVIRGTSQNDLTLDRLAVFNLQLNGAFRVLQRGRYFLDLEGGGTVYASGTATDYVFDNGLEIYGRLSATRAVGPLQAFVAATISHGVFHTTIVNQNPTEFTGNIGIRFIP